MSSPIHQGSTGKKRAQGSFLILIAAFSSCIVVAAVAIFALSMIKYLESVNLEELAQRGSLAATSVESSISQSLALDDHYAVTKQCQVMVREAEDIDYIVVTMRDGDALFHDKDGWSTETDLAYWRSFENAERACTEIVEATEKTPHKVLHHADPINYLGSLHLGWVHVGISTENHSENMSQFRNHTLKMALTALAFGIPASLIFSRRFTRPITYLKEFAEKVASGDLDSRVDAKGSREITELANTMNWMTERLADSREQLASSLKKESALREKDVLLREIHHRVKNNMQILGGLIRMQCRTLKSEESKKVLMESETRIRSMALLHQKLYQSESISEIAFGGYVSVLVGELKRLYGDRNSEIKTKIHIDSTFTLGLDTALPCGLIINELVSNAFKYAFSQTSGEISVTIVPKDCGQFVLEISDTGVGVPEKIDLANATSLGLRLVRMMVEQLEGTLEMQTTNGTTFTITLCRSDYVERLGERELTLAN